MFIMMTITLYCMDAYLRLNIIVIFLSFKIKEFFSQLNYIFITIIIVKT